MKQKSNSVSVKNTNTIPVIQSLGRLYKKKIKENCRGRNSKSMATITSHVSIPCID